MPLKQVDALQHRLTEFGGVRVRGGLCKLLLETLLRGDQYDQVCDWLQR